MTAYYNEIDPFAAQWLRELIKAGHIAPGEVDERSIEDVIPSELVGFTQCHFFAGIGVWSHALRQAGWHDDRPVWTGSCPCQPFSAAGKRGGLADERNLWSAFEWLIRICKPDLILGEQVEAALRHDWLDHVGLSLEALGYSVGAVGFPACSVGAPHIRQRLYWVAYSGIGTRQRDTGSVLAAETQCGGTRKHNGNMPVGHSDGGPTGLVADAEQYAGEQGRTAIKSRGGYEETSAGPYAESGRRGHPGELGDSGQPGHEGCIRPGYMELHRGAEPIRPTSETGATNGFWSDAEWIPCRDGKARPTGRGIHPLVRKLEHTELRGCESRQLRMGRERTESQCSIDTGKQESGPTQPSTLPLAHGAAARVGRLRGYGNAIVAPQAEAFIRAFMELILIKQHQKVARQ